MTSAISAPNLAKLRKSPQWSELFLAGWETPPIIFAARVNQSTFGTTGKPYDMIAQIAYDTVTTGAYTDVVNGQTLWVGSAAGLHDLGQARIRKTPTSTVIYIGEQSSIEWADNLYLSVVDEMLIWPKHARIVNQVAYMDYDVAYSDQHTVFDPVPVWGGNRVLDVQSYPAVINFNAASSWVFGSSIATYAFSSAVGTWTNPTTSTPSLSLASYPANGRVRVKLIVTAANGKTTTSYRYIYVYDATHRPHEIFQLGSCSGSMDTGGFSFDVTMLGNVSQTTIRDRAPMILFAKDHYGKLDTEVESLGQLAGHENIVACGWVDGETIQWDSESSLVEFTVQGPQFWLDSMQGFPPGVEINRPGVTAAWTTMPSLTVDKAMWHLLHWRSTADVVIDFYPTNDTRLAGAFEVPTESIWQQIVEIAQTSIFANPCCDQYNRLFVEVDANLVPEDERPVFPVVMAITKADWQEQITTDRMIRGQTSLLDLSGVAVDSHGKGLPYFSLANGHIFTQYGEITINDRLLLSDQSQANELAGLAFGKYNNEYPSFEIRMSQNNRMIGICPRQYVSMSIAAGDTIRGITYSGNLIPRSVSFEWSPDTCALITTLSCEAETFEQIAITGDKPEDSSIPPDGGGGGNPPPPPPIDPGEVPPDGPHVGVLATDQGVFYTINLNEASPEWFGMNSGLTTSNMANAHLLVRWMGRCSDGNLLALASDDASTHWSIFSSPGVGGIWTLLLENDPVDTLQVVAGVGVDPDKGNAVFAIKDGPPYGLSSVFATAYTYYGDSSAVALAGATVGNHNYRFSVACMAAGAWNCMMVKRTISTTSWKYSTFTNDGSAALSAMANDAVFGNWVNRYGISGMITGGGFLYCYIGGQDAGLVIKATANGNGIWTGITLLTNSPGLTQTGSFNTPGALCCSSDGMYLMGGRSGLIGQRSSDYGATWQNVGTGGTGGMTVGFHIWQTLGGWWYAATSQKLIRSNDWGATWDNRTGTLATVAPLCNPNYILVAP